MGSISSILSFLDLPVVSLQSRIMDFLLILRNRKLHVWLATLSTPSNSEQLWPSVGLTEGKVKENNIYLVGARKEEHGPGECKSQYLF